MKEDRILKMVLNTKVRGRYPRRRRKETWEQQVRKVSHGKKKGHSKKVNRRRSYGQREMDRLTCYTVHVNWKRFRK
jgi:hypothetical protein